MFKYFVVLALAIAAVRAIERHPESEPCEASSVFFVDCNRCRCANDGNGAICTRKNCIPGEYDNHGVLIAAHNINKRSTADDIIIVNEVPQNCEVGKKYRVDCNSCLCSPNGQLVCTRKKCVPAPAKRSIHHNYQELPDKNCEFGRTYKKNCNTCLCGRMGIATCTNRDCGVDIVYYSRKTRSAEKWGPLFKQGDRCKPTEKFMSECNECICAKDGKSAACTYIMCPFQFEQ